MLILTRKIGESILIGDNILIKVVETGKNSIRIGIDAPKEVTVLRQEVYESIQKENILSAKGEKIDITKAAKLMGNSKESKSKE